jgi:hypothetical protein
MGEQDAKIWESPTKGRRIKTNVVVLLGRACASLDTNTGPMDGWMDGYTNKQTWTMTTKQAACWYCNRVVDREARNSTLFLEPLSILSLCSVALHWMNMLLEVRLQYRLVRRWCDAPKRDPRTKHKDKWGWHQRYFRWHTWPRLLQLCLFLMIA